MKKYIFLLKEKLLNNKRNFLITIVFVIGLIATVVFLQRQQIFRSGAYVNNDAFELKSVNNKELDCDNRVCTTDTLRVRIKLIDLDKLEK